jgi:hypothetical protein
MKIEQVTPAIGAEISDICLNNLRPTDFDDIYQALIAHISPLPKALVSQNHRTQFTQALRVMKTLCYSKVVPAASLTLTIGTKT